MTVETLLDCGDGTYARYELIDSRLVPALAWLAATVSPVPLVAVYASLDLDESGEHAADPA